MMTRVVLTVMLDRTEWAKEVMTGCPPRHNELVAMPGRQFVVCGIVHFPNEGFVRVNLSAIGLGDPPTPEALAELGFSISPYRL